MAFGIPRGPLVTLPFAVVVFPTLCAFLTPVLQVAEWVVIDPEGLRGSTYLGREVAFEWTQIDSIQKLTARGFEGSVRLLRITSEGRDLVTTERMQHFEVLADSVETLAVRAKSTPVPRILDRIVYGAVSGWVSQEGRSS